MVIPVLYDSYARIRNAVIRRRVSTTLLYSRLVLDIIDLLYREGYIMSYSIIYLNRLSCKIPTHIKVEFNSASSVLKYIYVYSKPSKRIYCGVRKLMSRKYDGFELIVLSTSKGVMCRHECILNGLGGEILFSIYIH